MKKTMLVVMVIGLLGALLVTPEAMAAKKAKPRAFKGTYTCPCGINVAGNGPAFRLGSGEGGFEVPVLAGEKKISLKLTDDSGLPVYFEITQDVDGDGTFYEHSAGSGCGKTDGPVTLEPSAPIVVFISSGQCGTGAGLATGGTFSATLSG